MIFDMPISKDGLFVHTVLFLSAFLFTRLIFARAGILVFNGNVTFQLTGMDKNMEFWIQQHGIICGNHIVDTSNVMRERSCIAMLGICYTQ